MKILITGTSGFLGKHIVDEAVKQGHEVLCLRHSEIDTCQEKVNAFAPEILVHCAWGGVSAADRNNPELQAANIEMSKKVVMLYPFKQIIGAGSQDEYGNINEVVDEEHPLSPISEYAKAKISFCNWLKEYSETRNIEWQWIRIFNMYGTGQASNWLIPAIIAKCKKGEKTMDTTKGEQRYAYLNADDFGRAMVSVFGSKGKYGIYNISSSNPKPLRDIFVMIKNLTHSDIEFNFGAMPYRQGQSMMICGNANKFKQAFGEFETVGLEDGIKTLL